MKLTLYVYFIPWIGKKVNFSEHTSLKFDERLVISSICFRSSAFNHS
jgi:hypothetical protein